MLSPTIDLAASYSPIAEAVSVAFKSEKISQITWPVKNTFIEFDIPPLVSPVNLLRSSSCPQFFPSARSLADAACWEGATQVLCHAMVPKMNPRDENIIPLPCSSGLLAQVHNTTAWNLDAPVFQPGLNCLEDGQHDAACLACTDSHFAVPQTESLEEVTSSATSVFATPVSSPRCSWSTASQGTYTPIPSETSGGQRCAQSVASSDWTAHWPHSTLYFQEHDVGIVDDDDFFVARRLLGPDGENLKHIGEEARGAEVWINGRDSDRAGVSSGTVAGPLKICISATSQTSLHDAAVLVQDMLRSVHDDYKRVLSRRASSCSPTIIEATHSTCMHSCGFKVGIEDESTFQVVKRLVGKSGKNVKRIESQSDGASVRICGRRNARESNSEEPLMVHVSAATLESLDVAAMAVATLIKRVHVDYHNFCLREGGAAPVLAVVCEAGEA